MWAATALGALGGSHVLAGRGRPAADCAGELEHAFGTLRDRFGCDHRAPFAAVYVWVQSTLRRTVQERPGFFADPAWVARDLNARFAGLYLRALRADQDGRPVPEAWRIAFAAARNGQTDAGQDVLLAANAHIQRDEPYALAGSGLTRPDGTSRKPDHDRFQSVLDRAYGPAVQDVARRHDPLVATADDRWNPVAGLSAHELFVMWRQNAWYYARGLAGARSVAEYRNVSRTIEVNAAAWGRLLAAVQVPGYRVVRDGYCRGGRGTAA